MPENFKYDVFLSHSAKDKAVVRELAVRKHLRVWFDEWVLKAGNSFGLRTSQFGLPTGLGHSDFGFPNSEFGFAQPGTRGNQPSK